MVKAEINFELCSNGNFDDLIVPREPKNVRHILYNLEDDATKKIYKDEIEDWFWYLEVVRKSRLLGLNKRQEIAIFYDPDGGGYKIHDNIHRKETMDEIKKEPGFYKGFPLIDPNLQALPNPAHGNSFEVSKIDPNKPVRYTKENIDNFWKFADGEIDHDGNYIGTSFSKLKTIKNKNGENVQVYANRLPEECFGFQPGDIYEYKSRFFSSSLYKNGNIYFKGKTKIENDLKFAQNAEEAMDLAFFGKDYDEPQSKNVIRKGNPVMGWIKNPNVNLQFNEVKEWSRLTTLNRYYEVLKDFEDCYWVIAGDATGTWSNPAPKYDEPETKKKIDAGYNLAKQFITDYEKWLEVSISSLNKTQLEVIKAELEKWKTTRFYTSGGVWKPVIDNYLVEVNNALSQLNDNSDDDGDPDDGPKNETPNKDVPNIPTWKMELAELKTYGSELAQKIYLNCQPDQDGFTEMVFEELKKLVKLLEEAHGTKTTNTKIELEKFISDSENNANQRKALEIAKKVKNQDNDNEDCVATALEKLKTPAEKRLEQAHQKLKNLLAGLKINGKEAYEEMITDISNSETEINKVIEIWQKCQEVDEANNDDNGELLDTLNNFKNELITKRAWEIVNKYKNKDQSQGYANDCWNKLNDWAEQRKKNYLDIKNAKSKANFQVAKEEFIKKPEYQNDKQDYDEIYFPLAEKAAEIREKGNKASSEEKELSELITIVVSEYTDWKTQLTDLENKLSKLIKYDQDGEKYNITKNYSTVQQTALKNLIKKMEAKVEEWRTQRRKFEKNNSSQQNSPWYQTPLVIIGIIVVIVAFIGGVIYYLVKQRSSKKDH